MTEDGKTLLGAAVAGLVVGGALTAVLALRKGRDLEIRGALLSAALGREGSNIEVALAAYGSAMEPRLASYAEQFANEHLATSYGLTPERLAALPRLMARFGIT